ncbi:MFS transporter [Actinoplanes sp. M2I2]|uniref:MFS transporter n=1 Tax=Actinoplanes sp. M2I2 TaxID=1734444 RepID=UPI002021BECA|nr:MFS transporter [Actinoplanes sp. M2I2]
MKPPAGLLTAEAVSLAGSHIATVAVPWLVLVTTGSATRVGVVALAQTLPFVLAGVLGGALVDRTSPRRVAIAADVAGAVAVSVIPVLHLLGQLTFGRLVAAVMIAGAVGGCGNIAKRALLPLAVEASGTPMTRATALFDGFGRAALLVGLPLGGVLVAAFGPATVLIVAFGLVGGVFGLGAAVYSVLAVRLPRAITFVLCFLVAGSPRLFTMALTEELWLMLTVAFGAGIAISTVNPILMAVSYERVPAHLRGRVLGVIGALSFAGIPLGGLLGGLSVDSVGLRAALLGGGALYLVVTLAPVLAVRRLGPALRTVG